MVIFGHFAMEFNQVKWPKRANFENDCLDQN